MCLGALVVLGITQRLAFADDLDSLRQSDTWRLWRLLLTCAIGVLVLSRRGGERVVAGSAQLAHDSGAALGQATPRQRPHAQGRPVLKQWQSRYSKDPGATHRASRTAQPGG